jgi:hypothetical protein
MVVRLPALAAKDAELAYNATVSADAVVALRSKRVATAKAAPYLSDREDISGLRLWP